MNDLSDVLERIKHVPLGALVAELRELHQHGAAPVAARSPSAAPARAARSIAAADTAHAAPPNATGAEAVQGERSHALQPIVELLRRAATVTTNAPGPSALAPGVPGHPARLEQTGAHADRYALLRRHFGEQETQLRRQAQLTDRILSQLERGEVASALPRSTPLQQEIRILCPAGGRSGGRVVLRNELGRPVLLALRPHAPHGADATFDGLQVSCEPRELELAADEERLVRVAVDLAGCVATATGALELVVDALVDDEIVQKVWVAVVIVRPASQATAGQPT